MSHLQSGLDISRYGNTAPTTLKGVIDIKPTGKVSQVSR